MVIAAAAALMVLSVLIICLNCAKRPEDRARSDQEQMEYLSAYTARHKKTQTKGARTEHSG